MGTKYIQRITSQRGDTIVEVLVALAVLGLIVGAASALAGRSTKSLQDTQEKAVALRLAQGQLEYIKTYTVTHPDDVQVGMSGFCMKQNDALPDKPLIKAGGGDCVGTVGDGGADYTKSITLQPTADGAGIDATATVKWDTQNVKDTDVKLTYRLYKSLGASDIGGGGSCDPGWYRPTPTSPCIESPPSVVVRVQKIAPDAGNIQPSCTKAASQNRSGTRVQLNGAAGTTKNTDSNSNATFENLVRNAAYSATIQSVPAGYQLCDSTNTPRAVPYTDSKTVVGAPGFPQAITMKIRPICSQSQSTSYGAWRDIREDQYGWVADYDWVITQWVRPWDAASAGGFSDGYQGTSVGEYAVPPNHKMVRQADHAQSSPGNWAQSPSWRTINGVTQWWYWYNVWVAIREYRQVGQHWGVTASNVLVRQDRTNTVTTTYSCTESPNYSTSYQYGESRYGGW